MREKVKRMLYSTLKRPYQRAIDEPYGSCVPIRLSMICASAHGDLHSNFKALCHWPIYISTIHLLSMVSVLDAACQVTRCRLHLQEGGKRNVPHCLSTSSDMKIITTADEPEQARDQAESKTAESSQHHPVPPSCSLICNHAGNGCQK